MTKSGDLIQIKANPNTIGGTWTFFSENSDFFTADPGAVCLVLEQIDADESEDLLSEYDEDYKLQSCYYKLQSSCGTVFLISGNQIRDGVTEPVNNH